MKRVCIRPVLISLIGCLLLAGCGSKDQQKAEQVQAAAFEEQETETASSSAAEDAASPADENVQDKTAEETPEQENSEKKVAKDGADMQTSDTSMPTRIPMEGGTKINMYFGDTVIPGVLNDSETAKALIEKLPVTQHMNRYSHDFCGTTEELPYNEEEVHYGWLNGDIDYATDAPYFTILFEDEDASEQYGSQVNIGVITCPLSEIASLEGSFDVRIELAKAEEEETAVAAASEGKDSGAVAVYFSRVGNTEFPEGIDAVSSASLQEDNGILKGNAQLIAEWIADEAGCTTFEIVTENAYPADYDETVEQARNEQGENMRPALKTELEGLEDCHTVFLVFPNWWGDLPMPVYTFLDSYDLGGKTISVFVTHEGSSFSRTLETIGELEPGAEVVDGLSVQGGSVTGTEADIRQWVRDHYQMAAAQPEETKESTGMILHINEAAVPVTWEDNSSVEELKALLPLTIDMSMYGGFEQVGPIGQNITDNDQETTTDFGDIVLYSGNQIVLFYGSNSWAYTRLGHIDLSQQEMTELLANGDVSITISLE